MYIYMYHNPHTADQEVFNKGVLFNAGVLEALDHAIGSLEHCLILHDADSLPLKITNDYSCQNNTLKSLLRVRSDRLTR